MDQRVIHISAELHQDVKKHCKASGITMQRWVEHILISALDSSKKVLPEMEEGLNGQNPWERVPFWVGRKNPIKEEREKGRKG